MAALRKIVLDPKWLNTLHYYVRFRYLPGLVGVYVKTLIMIILDCFLNDSVEGFQIIGLEQFLDLSISDIQVCRSQ